MIKALNLYAGIGGNRRLWQGVQVTAVEYDEKIANIYAELYPDDIVLIGDAHDYLRNHVREFDFIWTSPPCPTHSRLRLQAQDMEWFKFEYPDMKLYEEILFLQQFSRHKWIVENVISWYNPLIKPIKIGRHYYWSNFNIPVIAVDDSDINGSIEYREQKYGFDLSGYIGIDRNKILNNCVEPEIGKYIIECAIREQQKIL